ncbi:hypothetical protein [Lyngbya sp. CCY1209]|uniref:hypothetical protein n=1 Tax=Lyngbya sp. CCY1209 TaxID=2886103 RepID=UPI002D20AE45|nr:hypothetical protein [Lyngbya sp. CCY1209]MEB3886088.1 hypothetical protein [Lyngbya sp. CCY1209]
MIRRLVALTSLVVLSTFGISTAARAGEGGVAGSAAFTVNGTAVTGVAVSAAVGKEFAAAHSFNYDGSNANGLQNSAFAIGAAGEVGIVGLGDPAGFTLDVLEDSDRATAQANNFTAGYTIQIGTQSGNTLVDAP